MLAPAKAAEVKTCFKLPPDAKVTPALSAAAPMIGAIAALAPNAVPIAGINAGTKIATAGIMIGATLLTIDLKPFHKSLKMLNSMMPVSGLTVPDPPCSFNSCASSGVM